jgi:DNA polymerase III epsilon subunit-like protein
MTKSNKICFIYTHTNGIHDTTEDVSKKNLFEFARLVQLKYSVGYYEDDKYIEEIKEKFILKPKCITFNKDAENIHKITYKKAEKKGYENSYILNKFREDLNGVQIIIGHNLNFHLKSIQVEQFRTCTYIDFNNYVLLDLMNFNHKMSIMSLNNLAIHYKIDTEKYSDIKLLKNIFPLIYNEYIKKN